MRQLLHNPLAVISAYYVASAFISGMPAPAATDGKGYRWLYSTLHIFAANFGNIAAQWRNGGSPLGPVLSQSTAAVLRGIDPARPTNPTGDPSNKYTV